METEKCLKDANALIAEFEWLQSQVSSTTALEIQEHIQRIKDAPTVDAVEVVHGHNTYDHNSAFGCSVCGFGDWDTNTADIQKYNYCPNCGAKMDGDGNAAN